MREMVSVLSGAVVAVALLVSSVPATAQETWLLQSGAAAANPQQPMERERTQSSPGGGSRREPSRPPVPPPTISAPPTQLGPYPAPPPPTTSSPPRQIGPQPAPPIFSPGWPIKRPLNRVIVRPRYDDRHRHDDRHDYHDRHHYYYGRPLVYLPLLFFGGLYIERYDDPYYWHNRLLWEDAITIYGDEGWIEFTLDCGARGEKLWIEVRGGRGRIDWAEIVFEDGTAQVIEFSDRSLGPGLYGLLDFREYRRVDHVRMAARASSREMRLILRLER